MCVKHLLKSLVIVKGVTKTNDGNSHNTEGGKSEIVNANLLHF